MTSPTSSSTRAALAAVLLAVNPVLYLVAEGVAAAAWRNPAYSYSYNYISDLGVPDLDSFQGRVIDSPLHWVMNTGFIAHGVLFVIVMLLVRGLFDATRTRRAITVLAILHGVGIALVGIFHGSQQATQDGTAVLHGAGALLAIIAGNAAFITAGTALLRGRLQAGQVRNIPSRRRLAGLFIALGVVGIAAFVYLLSTAGSAYDGIPERVAVYTVMAAELLAATALLTTRTSTATSAAPTTLVR